MTRSRISGGQTNEIDISLLTAVSSRPSLLLKVLHCAKLTSERHNSVNFQSTFTNEFQDLDYGFFYPTK